VVHEGKEMEVKVLGFTASRGGEPKFWGSQQAGEGKWYETEKLPSNLTISF